MATVGDLNREWQLGQPLRRLGQILRRKADPRVALIMKTVISVTFMITGLIMLAQPVRGGPRGGGGGFSGGGAHFSGGGSHFSGGSAHSSSGGSHFSSGVPRLVGEGTHFASF